MKPRAGRHDSSIPIGDTSPRATAKGSARSIAAGSGLRRRSYQGWLLRSGMLRDGSGNPPAIRINAAASIPAHPPPKKAANNHQAETIQVAPFLSLVSPLGENAPRPRFDPTPAIEIAALPQIKPLPRLQKVRRRPDLSPR